MNALKAIANKVMNTIANAVNKIKEIVQDLIVCTFEVVESVIDNPTPMLMSVVVASTTALYLSNFGLLLVALKVLTALVLTVTGYTVGSYLINSLFVTPASALTIVVKSVKEQPIQTVKSFIPSSDNVVIIRSIKI